MYGEFAAILSPHIRESDINHSLINYFVDSPSLAHGEHPTINKRNVRRNNGARLSTN